MKESNFYKFLLFLSILLLLGILYRNVRELFDSRKCAGLSFPNCKLTDCTYQDSCKTIEAINYSTDFNLDFERKIKLANITEANGSKVSYRVNHGDIEKRNRNVTLYYFNGNNTYGYLSDFYGKNNVVSMFIIIGSSEEEIPILSGTSFYWYLAKKMDNNIDNIYKMNLKIQTNRLPQRIKIIEFDTEIKADKLYYFYLFLNKNITRFAVLNEELTDNNTVGGADNLKMIDDLVQEYSLSDEKYTISELVSPHMLIGSNIDRTLFFKGHIGKLNITRTNYQLSQAAIDSNYYPKEIKAKDMGNLLDISSDDAIPSALYLVAQANETSITLYWIRPNKGYNTLKEYIIMYTAGDSVPRFIFDKDIDCEECQYTLNNVDRTLEYIFVISAKNKEGISELSTKVKVAPLVLPGTSTGTQQATRNLPRVSCNPNGTYDIVAPARLGNGNKCSSEPSLIMDTYQKLNTVLRDYLTDSPRQSVNLDLQFR